MADKTRRRRDDGETTRQQILQAAGEIFAEKGVDRATGKEIAARAGTNSASVNYYFGSLGGLYQQVLIEAHRQFITIDRLSSVFAQDIEPKAKLTLVFQTVVSTLLEGTSRSWVMKVLIREVLTPSEAFGALAQNEILPKKQIISSIVADYLGVPSDHPAIMPATVGVVAPVLLLLIGEKTVLPTLFPGLGEGHESMQELTGALQQFLFGGLDALAAGLK